MNRLLPALFLAVACGSSPPPEAPEPAKAEAPATAEPAEKAAPAPEAGPPARGDDSTRQSKNGTATLTLGDTEVTVTYGRPKANGRTVWGELVPYGKVWRTGADEATVIHFTGDAKLGDTPVKAGSYALFTIPEDGKWTLVLNTVAEQWGSYEHDASKDVARAEVVPEKAEAAEVFTIAPDGDTLYLHWAELRAPVPLSAM